MGRNKTPNTIIRIQTDVFEELMRITKMTRRPTSEIASEALRYALENSHLVESKVYDVSFGECSGKESSR